MLVNTKFVDGAHYSTETILNTIFTSVLYKFASVLSDVQGVGKGRPNIKRCYRNPSGPWFEIVIRTKAQTGDDLYDRNVWDRIRASCGHLEIFRITYRRYVELKMPGYACSEGDFCTHQAEGVCGYR